LRINIRHDILSIVNYVSKVLQFKSMHINIVIDNLRAFISYEKKIYKENGY